jgi:hypothetical protein
MLSGGKGGGVLNRLTPCMMSVGQVTLTELLGILNLWDR